MRNTRMLGVFVATLASALMAMPALADDVDWTGDIAGTGAGSAIDFVHTDTAPWAGWVNVEVTNTGSEAWGDFHFEIFDPVGGQDISNIHWLDASMGGFDPTSSQSPLSWTIDNVTIGATIDLFYYTDPVLPGETATFSVYNVNPDQITQFGVMFYPTLVPEPATLAMLALAGLGLVRRR